MGRCREGGEVLEPFSQSTRAFQSLKVHLSDVTMEILGLKNKLQLIAGDEQDVIVKMRDAITAKSVSMVVPRQK